MKNRKLPYIWVLVNGIKELWPYEEAQEFTIYKLPKEDIIWLNDKEYEELERNKQD